VTTSTSRLAFTDCEDVFEKAFTDPVGIRVMFEEEGKANHFIGRMHRFRELDRLANAQEHPPGHPLHGRSKYDQCVVRRPRPEAFADSSIGWWVYVEKMTIENMVIESLSDLPVYQEPKRLENMSKEAAE
jgi:hypothetical protein